jgi:predicted AlkP superfamily pyrophosphatase or phosphodiesterase
MFPSFPREWVTDRERALATVYLLRSEKPDLLLVHLADLDSDAHENGPYTPEANATLEYTDELVGSILAVVPRGGVVALVSDHGFERVDRVLNIPALLTKENVPGQVQAMGGIAVARDEAGAAALRRLAIGREIPKHEVASYAPQLTSAAAVFEPPHHTQFGTGSGDLYTAPREKGDHGFWPTRQDYRSVFLLYGAGISSIQIGEISMLDIFPRLRSLLSTPSAKAAR